MFSCDVGWRFMLLESRVDCILHMLQRRMNSSSVLNTKLISISQMPNFIILTQEYSFHFIFPLTKFYRVECNVSIHPSTTHNHTYSHQSFQVP